MHSINPYLRAFFKSSLPASCNPINDYILLVPTTECLLNGRDKDSDSDYTELAISEDFLASHVLHIERSTDPSGGNVRENRNKAKQIQTLNGRTVIIKESFVYSNKGFKHLTQAQLLNDQLFYGDSLDVQAWLIYFISKPLHGSYEYINPPQSAYLRTSLDPKSLGNASAVVPANRTPKAASEESGLKSFNDVLGQYPLIARQMQNGLKSIFYQSRRELEAICRQDGTDGQSTDRTSNGSLGPSHGPNGMPPVPIERARLEYQEDQLRKTLEAAVTASIDLFQQVDKQQLSLLGASSNLTGPDVERLIERYITEQLHDSTIFPFLCAKEKQADSELEARIHSMHFVDLAQIGVAVEGGVAVREQLVNRIGKAVEEFGKLGVSGSPHEMLEILLATQRIITSGEGKAQNSQLATSADTLVSLLLLVVIRSQTRYLNARLLYMRNFMFVDDVETGEIGYALSTLEAVLSYLTTDSGGLRKASKKNKRLWQAIKEGNIEQVRSILEPSGPDADDNEDVFLPDAQSDETPGYSSETSTLAHVFPFQTLLTPRKAKRVSMDMQSISGSSEYSFASRTTTIDSRTSAIEGDMSVPTLSQTRDEKGTSLLMMAIDTRQSHMLRYLLSLEELFPLSSVLADKDGEGTTLLSAAVQSSNIELVEAITEKLGSQPDTITEYFRRTDNRGRSAAHYLFNLPAVIPRFHRIIPWTIRDRLGQTPLFALCRSYDHPNYSTMVEDAIAFAAKQQADGKKLHLDEHVDIKRNTLLHIIKDPAITARILQHCDSDPNATNDKQFTPLMMASKYGRIDVVRTLFSDERVDVNAKEYRGMTAVELAKDDEIRNRMDEMVMLFRVPAVKGRVTAIVRSLFVDDGSIRMIIKSALPSDPGTIDVTTCRRSLTDFENLARWLSMEHPASWLPSIFNFRSPFQIPSRPSPAVLQDVQYRLESFLKIMLAHSTFNEHELLWEFYLFPEIQLDMMAERSRKKADARTENIRDELEPVRDSHDLREIMVFVDHARESIRAVNHCTKSVTRRLTGIRVGLSNVAAAGTFAADGFALLDFVPMAHVLALQRFANSIHPYASDPYKMFHYDLQAILSTTLAMLSSLARPNALISSLSSVQKAIERHDASSRRTDRWPLALLEETRKGIQADAQDRAARSRQELRTIGCELRYTQQTVASELAGWQEQHAQQGRQAIRKFAQQMVLREKDRLDNMKRAVRGVVDIKDVPPRGRSRRR